MQFEQVMGLTVKSGGKGEKEFIDEIKEGLQGRWLTRQDCRQCDAGVWTYHMLWKLESCH